MTFADSKFCNSRVKPVTPVPICWVKFSDIGTGYAQLDWRPIGMGLYINSTMRQVIREGPRAWDRYKCSSRVKVPSLRDTTIDI